MSEHAHTETVSWDLWSLLWRMVGLDAPSRPGPCWCNYGDSGDADDNDERYDLHHHGFCRANRVLLRQEMSKRGITCSEQNPGTMAQQSTVDLTTRVTDLEYEVTKRVTALEADLCAHSIATRKADDDLAARIERLEHAHKGTIPIDALRRMVEWAWLHWSSQPRDRDRWTAVYAAIELWCPEIGHFTVDWENGTYGWIGKESV